MIPTHSVHSPADAQLHRNDRGVGAALAAAPALYVSKTDKFVLYNTAAGALVTSPISTSTPQSLVATGATDIDAISTSEGWALIAGLLWAAAVVYAFPRDNMSLQLVILFLVGGLGSGAVGSMPSQPVACVGFMGPPLVSVLILLATQDGQIAHVFTLMGSLFIIVLMAALTSGFTSFAMIVRTRIDRVGFGNRSKNLPMRRA